MGRRLQIGLAVLLVVLIGAAVGAYAWDQSKKDEISNGIRVGGVPTGDDVHRNLRPRVGYSHEELSHFVSVAAQAIDQPPQDATVQPTPSSLVKVAGQDGVSVEQARLRDMIEREITSDKRTPLRAP